MCLQSNTSARRDLVLSPDVLMVTLTGVSRVPLVTLSPWAPGPVSVPYTGAGHSQFAGQQHQKQGWRWFCSAELGHREGSSAPGGCWGSQSRWRGWWVGSGSLWWGGGWAAQKAGRDLCEWSQQCLLPGTFLKAWTLCCAGNQHSEQTQAPRAPGRRENGLWRDEDCQIQRTTNQMVGNPKPKTWENSWKGERFLEAQGKETHCTRHEQTPKVFKLELNFIKLDKQLYW